ncbi:MAG: hypothetical protein P9L99_17590 [Candidatus Lernaella stagnicola]|nr:hypothetical protein [Candidatus Lernaella stagnicola]
MPEPIGEYTAHFGVLIDQQAEEFVAREDLDDFLDQFAAAAGEWDVVVFAPVFVKQPVDPEVVQRAHDFVPRITEVREGRRHQFPIAEMAGDKNAAGPWRTQRAR